jgi:hypothetical protein
MLLIKFYDKNLSSYTPQIDINIIIKLFINNIFDNL